MSLYQIPYFKFSILIISLLLFSCENEPKEEIPVDYGYEIVINSPFENQTYNLGDTIPLQIDFKSNTGEIVHYIGVDIYQKDKSSNLIYSVYAHQHVVGEFIYQDNLILRDTNKIVESNEWILETTMWSHEDNPDTVRNSIELEILN